MRRLLIAFWLGVLCGSALVLYVRDHADFGVAVSLPGGCDHAAQTGPFPEATPVRARVPARSQRDAGRHPGRL